MPRSGRFARSLGLAALAHALFVAWAVWRRTPAPPPDAGEEETVVWLDEPSAGASASSTVDQPPRENAASSAVPASSALEEETARSRLTKIDEWHAAIPAAPAASAAVREPPSKTAENSNPAPPVPSTAEPANPADGHLSLAELGLGGSNRFMVAPGDLGDERARLGAIAAAGGGRERESAGHVAAVEAERQAIRARANAALRAIPASDRALGLAPEGPVLRSLEEATRESTTPGNARAVFDVTIAADGQILGLEVVDASQDREGWAAVAHAAHAAARAKRLAMRGGGGRVVRIEVESRITMPSGADPGLDVTVLGVPLKHGEGERASRVDLLNPLKPQFPLSLMIDPADIGAQRQRVIHAHATGERPL